MIYGAGNILLAQAWWCLLSFLDKKIAKNRAIKIYGISQLAKYVPGNIFHLAGRQAMGMAAGVTAEILLKSTLWELTLITLAGALFSLLVLPLLWPAVSIFAAITIFAVLVIGCVRAMNHFLSHLLGTAMILQIIFLAISGFIFISVILIINPQAISPAMFITLCGAYVVAWLGGLITPGAPAGAGIREMILLFLLDGGVAQVDLLLAVVLGRMITVLGDLLFFTITFKYFNGEATWTERL
ncbi:hypothetical protein [Desulfocicer vacuolatum]|uniref:hypothetical protein n=1 Tax=Desulfocicer vacuolatum TaxID=2298 RepID=UPI00111C25E2|nr:hypothetical protein [Desulfocicer vacuolatum]